MEFSLLKRIKANNQKTDWDKVSGVYYNNISKFFADVIKKALSSEAPLTAGRFVFNCQDSQDKTIALMRMDMAMTDGKVDRLEFSFTGSNGLEGFTYSVLKSEVDITSLKVKVPTSVTPLEYVQTVVRGMGQHWLVPDCQLESEDNYTTNVYCGIPFSPTLFIKF